MVHGGSGGKGKKALPYLMGSATSGVLEIFLFHPVDTVAKRLMSNQTAIWDKALSTSENFAGINKVVFAKAADGGFLAKAKNLFPGVSFGVAYKVSQRTYKFGCQPLIKAWLDRKSGGWWRGTFGAKNGQDLMHACAGSLVGLGEIVLLPFDVLKIKAQTNPGALRGRGVVDIFVNENFKLYRGWNWTAARNMPGSFALFGFNSVVLTRVFGRHDAGDARGAFEIFCGSLAGGVFSILVSSPMDVIKTRIQNQDFDKKKSGARILWDMTTKEGPTSFFKGVVPKITLVGPKLVFAFTVAQWLISRFRDMMDKSVAQAEAEAEGAA